MAASVQELFEALGVVTVLSVTAALGVRSFLTYNRSGMIGWGVVSLLSAGLAWSLIGQPPEVTALGLFVSAGIGAGAGWFSRGQKAKHAWFWCVVLPLFVTPPVGFTVFAMVADPSMVITGDAWDE